MTTIHLSDENIRKYKSIVHNNVLLLADCPQENAFIKEYRDPDPYIEESIFINGNEYRMAPDGICGIKQLCNILTSKELVDVYITLRKFIIIWPRHKQSINQRRYRLFRDRIDFTLFDIKQFYETGSCKLVKNTNTRSFAFLNEFENFPDFVNQMGYLRFVDTNVSDYRVKNLGATELNCYISDYNQFSCDPTTLYTYIHNLVNLLSNKGETT